MKIRSILATTSSLLAIAGLLHATPLGVNTDPGGSAWNRGDANTAFASFDSFSSFSFANQTTGFATGGFATISFSQATELGSPATSQGAGVYDDVQAQTPGTDVLYSGARQPAFSVDGTTSFTAYGVVLQVKRAMSTSDSFETELVVTLNGLVPDSMKTVTGSGDSTSTLGTWAVTTYYWNSSISDGVTSYDIDISNMVPHRGYDSITLDVGPTPVPEPSTYAIAAVLIAFVGFRVYKTRRNRGAVRA